MKNRKLRIYHSTYLFKKAPTTGQRVEINTELSRYLNPGNRQTFNHPLKI